MPKKKYLGLNPMPRPAKTTRRPRVYRRKRRQYKRTYRKPTIGKLALRLFETKKQEYRETETAINSLTGWYANASAQILSQSTSYSGLDGHIVRGKGISFRGWVKNNATTTMLVRVGVILARRGSSISTDLYAGTNLFEGNTGNTNVGTANSAQKMTGRFNQDQYKLVKNFMFKLGASSATDASDIRTYKIWIPLKGRVFRYDGSGLLPTNDIFALFVMPVLGNNDESLGENLEHSFTSTFYYVDP